MSSVNIVIKSSSISRPFSKISFLLLSFQKGADAERYFTYIVKKVLPEFDELNINEETGDLKLELLKVLAEICTYKVSDEALKWSVEPIFDKLLVSS